MEIKAIEQNSFCQIGAAKVREAFLYLKGKEYMFCKPDAIICDILIAPYDEELKMAFVDYYRMCDAEQEKYARYTGKYCDVIVVAANIEKRFRHPDLYYMSIQTFCEKHGVGYEFPNYNTYKFFQ